MQKGIVHNVTASYSNQIYRGDLSRRMFFDKDRVDIDRFE
jgi:hypothetical protein